MTWTKTEQVTTQALLTADEVDLAFRVEPDGLHALVRVRTDKDRRGLAHDALVADVLTAQERAGLVTVLKKLRDSALTAMGYIET
jgi:hypothetical protein